MRLRAQVPTARWGAEGTRLIIFRIMKNKSSIVPIERIENRIYRIRDQKVILDRDLAELYEVETKALVRTMKRNRERFPEDFMFQLTKAESESSRCQIGTLKRGQNIKYAPYAFTEQGVAMLSGLLNSPRAVAVNVEIMRAFVRMRHAFLNQEKMGKTVEELKSFVLKHSNQTDREFRKVWNAIEKLAEPLPANTEPMGFKLDYPNTQGLRTKD